jgi:hypothetical protein
MFHRRLRNLLRRPTRLHYTAHPTNQRLSTAYMLLEQIGPNTGQILCSTWEEHKDDTFRRQKLFRGMARIILSMASVP